VDAVTKMSFADARGILMGNESSANYLQNSTSTALYGKFNPVIKIHLQSADKVWTNINYK
jgi:hypothetical protein